MKEDNTVRRGLYWFRNDLRLHDNPALLQLAGQCSHLLCVYVMDAHWFQWTRYQGKAMGAVRWQFILESLRDLHQQLQQLGHTLVIRVGRSEEIISELVHEHQIHIIGVNRLPGTYEARQLASLQLTLPNRHWLIEEAFTLFERSQLPFALQDLPASFTPFRKQVEGLSVLRPVHAPKRLPEAISAPSDPVPTRAEPQQSALRLPFRGGETAALSQLRYYLDSGQVRTYKETRNQLDGWDFSSKLSPWLAQGCVSPRRVVADLRAHEAAQGANESTYWLFFELLWREYYQWLHYKVGSHLYHLRGISRRNPLLSFYPEYYMAWREGNTDSAFVNAFMLQLKQTGWMSNRGRQIVASYFVNELGLDWRYGAAWFEEQLVDYDPANNWGNWQYLAGVGTDPRGRRRFDIEKQRLQYDPDGVFIQRYTEKDS